MTTGEEAKWCPQHGYPLPCAKCGMPKPDKGGSLVDEAIVKDMVERFKKWDARGTPYPVIMNKILVNIKPRLVAKEELVARGQLTLLVAEVQECSGDKKKIDALLQSWITANDLELENVRSYGSLEEALEAICSKEEEE